MTTARSFSQPLMGLRGLAALWVVSYHVRGTVYDVYPGLAVPILD
jgi:peptidoglycan/LPS O-acetylase OafA/YrhL